MAAAVYGKSHRVSGRRAIAFFQGGKGRFVVAGGGGNRRNHFVKIGAIPHGCVSPDLILVAVEFLLYDAGHKLASKFYGLTIITKIIVF